MRDRYCTLIVAAEASGDALGAQLIRSLRRRLGGAATFFGVGGAAMADEGVNSAFDVRELSIVGLLDGLWIYPRVLAWADQTAALADEHDADAAVLIDSWGFTIRVAERLRRRRPRMPIIKYVGPQVWAHRPGRAGRLARVADLLLSTQARDAPEYAGTGLRVEFVGDPALARDSSRVDDARFRDAIRVGLNAPILLVLPGSRPSEIRRLWPHFEDAVRRLQSDRRELHVVIPLARSVADDVRERAASWRPAPYLVDDPATKMDAMAAGTAALACSGTVTTELALAGTPMVVGYRLGPVSYAIVSRLYRLDHITPLNIAAGKRVVPEFVQGDCTGAALAAALTPLLDDPQAQRRQLAAQSAALHQMGRPGADPSEAAADAIVGVLTRDDR